MSDETKSTEATAELDQLTKPAELETVAKPGEETKPAAVEAVITDSSPLENAKVEASKEESIETKTEEAPAEEPVQTEETATTEETAVSEQNEDVAPVGQEEPKPGDANQPDESFKPIEIQEAPKEEETVKPPEPMREDEPVCEPAKDESSKAVEIQELPKVEESAEPSEPTAEEEQVCEPPKEEPKPAAEIIPQQQQLNGTGQPGDHVVLVTGATGFVGSHCVKALLDEGYQVRGTVRDLNNFKKVLPIRKLDPSGERLKLVEADLTHPVDIWKKAAEGCSYILHVASPVPASQPRNRDALLRPAVDGTMGVLRAAAETASVRRVVVCGSINAITTGNVRKNAEMTEEVWGDAESSYANAYDRSKIIAEKAAWEFIEEINQLPDDEQTPKPNVELVVLCFGMILGPVLHANDFASGIVVRTLMTGFMPLVPNLCIATLDVRDVARCHLAAMTASEEVIGRRIICVQQPSISLLDIAKILRQWFGDKGYKVPIRKAPTWMLTLASPFNATLKTICQYLDTPLKFDTAKMKNLLKIDDLVPMEKSVVDMANSMIELGIIEKPKTMPEKPVIENS